jgi:putative DNA-invertase from lambdoid prophage Rac
MVRCAIYVRVSTREQRLLQQFREIRRAVEARGWIVGAVYRERRSGAAGVDRPAWERLKHDAAMHRFAAVAVWSLDRCGRSALAILGALQAFEARRVRLLVAKDGLDTTGPTGHLVVTVLAGVAELERNLISERTKVGLAAARRRGVHLGRPFVHVDAKVLFEIDAKRRTVASAARDLGVSEMTLRRRLAKLRASIGANPYSAAVGAVIQFAHQHAITTRDVTAAAIGAGIGFVSARALSQPDEGISPRPQLPAPRPRTP